MNIINIIRTVFSSFSWETLSAIGTIGAVWLTMKELRKTVSYRNRYILEINLYSTMGIPSLLIDSKYTELTSLSFKIINKSDRNLEEYDISLEKNLVIMTKSHHTSMTMLNFLLHQAMNLL